MTSKDKPDLVAREHRGGNPFGVQAKLLYHLDRLHSYVQDDDALPIECEVNLTNRCNLKCERCISANMRSGDTLTLEVAQKFLVHFIGLGGKSIIFSGGGEPTCHPQFEEIALWGRGAGLDLGLMTNGAYESHLNPTLRSAFNWVRVSLDRRRRGDFKLHKGIDVLPRVIANIEELHGGNCKVWLNVNVDQQHTVRGMRLTIKELLPMVDGIQFRPLLPRPFEKEEPEVNEKVWEYLLSFPPHEKLGISRDKLDDLRLWRFFPFDHCDGHMLIPVLNANGDLCVCMYKTLDPACTFGNLYEDDLAAIWASDRRRKVIEYVRSLNYLADGCQPLCKLTEVGKFLHFIKREERPRDVNFL